MKTLPNTVVGRLLRLVFFIFAPALSAAPRHKRGVILLAFLFLSLNATRADVSMTLTIAHGYDFYYPSLGLVASNPDPVTYDRLESPNGIIWKNFGTNNDGNPFFLTNDLAAVLNECNGSWKLYVNKGAVSEQLYYFIVSVNGVTTNLLGDVVVLSPAGGSNGVTNQPTFYWTGPTNLPFVTVDVYHDNIGNSYSETLPGTATNWTPSGVLTPGANNFFIHYDSNNFPGFAFTTPTNSSGTLAGWTAQGNVFSYIFSSFSVRTNIAGGGSSGHTNIAHYTFENTNDIFKLGLDASPNGNNLVTYSYWGPVHTNTTDAMAGASAVQFFGTSSMICYDQVLTNLNAVLAGSFTFSAWVKTTNSRGNDADDAIGGATIFWAYNDQGGTNDTIPLAITGNKAAFSARDHLGNSTTVHSTSSVNDGNYHLITITRDQSSGEMKMYVDGSFEASEFGTTDPLNANTYYLSVGGTTSSSYTGLLDDLQIYSGVLSAAEVGEIFTNAGTTITDLVGGPANGIVAHYDFDENTELAPDVSGNGNNLVLAGQFDGSGPSMDTDHIATSGGSVYFDGGSFLSAPTNLLPTLAGSFTISLWVKTTQDNGDPNDVAWTGDVIISADMPNSGAHDLIPVALTGGQVAFNTANTEIGYDDTINSSATVNDGSWHHIVVSRNQPTGEKIIYIDGVSDTSDIDATNLLNDPKLLTIGCKADASDPDPASPANTGSNGYQGLLDDIQIYSRVLSPNEVAFLHENPGAVLTGIINTPYPVDANLQFNISRSQDPNYGEIYGGGVSFDSVSPDPTTTNSVHSPNNYFSTMQYPGGGTGSGAILGSLGEVLNEFTNGSWKIYINQGSPTQQVYSFQVSISGLDTNLLKAVKVFSPTNGSVNVATNPVFYWNGPSNYSTLQVEFLSGPVAYLPLNSTNWLSAPKLNYGPDRFDVSYTSNNFPGVTFTTPVDSTGTNFVRTWTTTVSLASQSFNNIYVGAPAPLPVQLLNKQIAGGNFRFTFQTLAGRPHIVQARTNLTLGTWVNVSNFTGDGSLKAISISNSVFNGSKQGFIRVSTQ